MYRPAAYEPQLRVFEAEAMEACCPPITGRSGAVSEREPEWHAAGTGRVHGVSDAPKPSLCHSHSAAARCRAAAVQVSAAAMVLRAHGVLPWGRSSGQPPETFRRGCWTQEELEYTPSLVLLLLPKTSKQRRGEGPRRCGQARGQARGPLRSSRHQKLCQLLHAADCANSALGRWRTSTAPARETRWRCAGSPATPQPPGTTSRCPSCAVIGGVLRVQSKKHSPGNRSFPLGASSQTLPFARTMSSGTGYSRYRSTRKTQTVV